MDPFQCQFLSNLHSFLEVNIGFKILVLKNTHGIVHTNLTARHI